MFVLRCFPDNKECKVLYKNIIGHNQIRNFFAECGWPLMTSELNWILNDKEETIKYFIFPNKIKTIIVERVTSIIEIEK